MLHTGFRTFHFVSFLYVFFFSFVSFLFSLFCFSFFLRFVFFFVSFRYFSPCFLFVFFLSVSFRFFSFFSVSQFTGTRILECENRFRTVKALPKSSRRIFFASPSAGEFYLPEIRAGNFFCEVFLPPPHKNLMDAP